MSFLDVAALRAALVGASQDRAQSFFEQHRDQVNPDSLSEAGCRELIALIEAASLQVPSGRNWKPSTRVRRFLNGFAPREQPSTPASHTAPIPPFPPLLQPGDALLGRYLGSGTAGPGPQIQRPMILSGVSSAAFGMTTSGSGQAGPSFFHPPLSQPLVPSETSGAHAPGLTRPGSRKWVPPRHPRSRWGRPTWAVLCNRGHRPSS